MANQRIGVPAGWTWRDGRPRWIPSPKLREAGWKGRDLKDGRGEWMGRGASIEAAQALADAVQAWKQGELVPAALAPSAPEGASTTPRAVDAIDPFSIGALMDAYLTSDELLKKHNGQPRPASTVNDYRRKLKRLVDALAGYARLPDPADRKDADAYTAAVAEIRAASVFVLEPVETGDGMIDPLRRAYRKLQEHAGVHMAFGVMSCASAWLAWSRRHKSRRIFNWAQDVERETPPGRIRVWTWPELAAFVAAAGRLGRDEVADAVILAIDLGWSQIDILNLTWDQIAREGGRLVAHGARQKTGRVGGTPFLSMGQRRLVQIEARQEVMAAKPVKVVHLVRQRKHRQLGPGADSDYLRDLFEEVRAAAVAGDKAAGVAPCPSCATLTFADTRDTGFSLGRQAGLTDDGIASRTRQSRANIKTLGDRNYGEIGPEISGPAADTLDAYVEAQLAKHGVNL